MSVCPIQITHFQRSCKISISNWISYYYYYSSFFFRIVVFYGVRVYELGPRYSARPNMLWFILCCHTYYRAPSLSHSMIISHWSEEIQFGYFLSSTSSFFFFFSFCEPLIRRVLFKVLFFSCNLLVNNIFGVCMPYRCIGVYRADTIYVIQAYRRTASTYTDRKLYVLVG